MKGMLLEESKKKVAHQLQFGSLIPVEVNAAIRLPIIFEAKWQQTANTKIVEDDLEVIAQVQTDEVILNLCSNTLYIIKGSVIIVSPN